MAFQNKIKAAAITALLILTGCPSAGKLYVKQGFKPPFVTAVLPMDNHTVDLDGADAVRFWFHQRLQEKKGYALLPLEQVDHAMNRLGISEGGQLSAVSSDRLRRELGVDAVIFGDLLDFGVQTTGFINVRKVRARFKLIQLSTGERLWETEGLGARSRGALSSQAALDAGVQSLGSQLAEKAMRSPLQTEIWDMIWDAIQYLPRGK